MMSRTYFADLYYPANSEELKGLCQAEAKVGHTPSLILLPHASIGFVHEMYQDAFALVHNPKRIVIVAPLHSKKMEADGNAAIFTLSGGDIDTPLGAVHLESVPGLPVADHYAEEEYTIELFYPYVALNSPKSTILPIFVRLENKEDIQALSRIMVSLKKEEHDSLFIISGNFTSIGKGDVVNSNAKTLKELLENNAPLLDAGNRNKISGCAYRIMEAARTAFPGRFSIVLARCGNYIGESITSEADGSIWQVYGVKE